MRRLPTVLALLVVVWLMTACIKFDVDLKVSSDDTVSGTVVVAFNKDLLSLTGQSAEQVIQGSGVGVPASGAPGTSVAPYEDDQFAGETITYEDVDLSQFNQGDAADSLKIERVGDEFHVSGAVDFSRENGANNPLGGTAQQALSSAQLSITLAFPGAVSSSNGQISGTSVTWTPKIGEKTDLTAVASAIGPPGGALWVWVIVGTALVAAVVVVLVMLRRRRDVPPPPGAEVPVAPPSSDG
jgi:hypothetical protein